MNSFTMNYAVHALIPMGDRETVDEYNKKNATKVIHPSTIQDYWISSMNRMISSIFLDSACV